MRKNLGMWILSLVLICSFAVPLSMSSQPGPVPPAGVWAAQRAEGREPHPEIRRALRALGNAKEALEHAAHDFGGHRVKALELTNQAIRECEAALQYDKR